MAGLLRYLQQSANRENRSCSPRNRLARAEGSEGARMMHQSAPGRSQPDRTKAYRARILPTLELHIHAHEKTRDAVRVAIVADLLAGQIGIGRC